MNKTILDTFLSEYPVTCTAQAVTVNEDELVHVVGTQEPVREQPDERLRVLLRERWLTVESIQSPLPDGERKALVRQVQQAARARLDALHEDRSDADQAQLRWLVEKTRPHESKQQIAHRVWLALVLYGLGERGLHFDAEGRTHWENGIAGRIGLAPDALLDLAWTHTTPIYATSFRKPDGTIARGKGRGRWYVYRLTVDPVVAPLFEQRQTVRQEKIALIVASETYATQPQLPRDFYGGNEFQQACIDAQDHPFDHMLVLSPEHGVISLDDTVPSDKPWDEVLEQQIWSWQMLAVQQLGMYLCHAQALQNQLGRDLNWWLWLNPASTYVFTIFGGGFAVRVLFDHLNRAHTRAPQMWPNIALDEYRTGYVMGDFDDDLDLDLDFEDDELSEELAFELAMQDINQLLEWATDFVSLVNIHIPPANDILELAADEAMIPMRLLMDGGVDVENLLDLLTDMTLLLEQMIPFSLLVNPGIAVSALLQLTHNVVHNEPDSIPDMLALFPNEVLHQYVERALQEPTQEDRLCACLTLAEQIQIVALTIPPQVAEQLLVWMQTYISGRLRQQLLGDDPDPLA